MNKEKGFALDSWGAYERNESSESIGLHFPILRLLNSLTQYLIFGVQTVCSLCCKFIYSLTFPPAFLEQFSQSYWDAVSLSSSPKLSHLIKINLYFQVMTIFFSQYAQSLLFLCKTEIHWDVHWKCNDLKTILFDFQEVVNVIKNSKHEQNCFRGKAINFPYGLCMIWKKNCQTEMM